MASFEQIRFTGTFRDYQQNVLDNVEKHLKDKKVHVVAAPGSGKTVLGLELIRRLGSPALILSPTVTIREQWGQRFEESFLPDAEDPGAYFSCSLKTPGLITSVTYQALHAAMHRQKIDAGDGDEDDCENGAIEDYAGFDLMGFFQKSGIRTICLDEAHHLKSEWQKSLEAFVKDVEKEVVIIALTATPPYDCTGAEWDRYVSLCGEIDEEIAVPELVAQGTLCPHQDYIHFSYPTAGEIMALREYKQKAADCVNDILRGPLFTQVLEKSGLFTDFTQNAELILENAKGFIAILCLANAKGMPIPKQLVRLVSPSGRLPAYRPEFAQTAFGFVLSRPDLFSQETADALQKELSRQGLIHRGEVCLSFNARLNRMLVSSMGKLGSIVDVAESEASGMGRSLRMLVLTDYIRKNLIGVIGSNQALDSMGVVPIFEALRRKNIPGQSIAAISGSLVIVPNDRIEAISSITQDKGIAAEFTRIGNTDYSRAAFSNSNRGTVAVMTEAFGRGLINILVGTKSLLGEGWDSPCINSLILASFVGSFVLSNQMRGRAIRTDPNNPHKTANIWHLVTVLPPTVSDKPLLTAIASAFADKSRLYGEDYDTLKRRFACFLGPAYHEPVIQSGIERIDILTPPFDEGGVSAINRAMFDLARDRQRLEKQWREAFGGAKHAEIVYANEMEKKAVPRGFVFFNAIGALVGMVLLSASPHLWALSQDSGPIGILAALIAGAIGFFCLMGGLRLIRHISPIRTIQTFGDCVVKTLLETGAIDSAAARCVVESDPDNLVIRCMLTNAAIHEKFVFEKAMGELFSAIDNPRYVLIKRSGFPPVSFLNYVLSFACPSVFGVKKEFAEAFAKQLQKTSGAFECFFTRNEQGRKMLLWCRSRAYVNLNENLITGRTMARKKWE